MLGYTLLCVLGKGNVKVLSAAGGQIRTAGGQVLKLGSPTKAGVGAGGQKVIAIQKSSGPGGPQIMQLVRTPQGAIIKGGGQTALKVISPAGVKTGAGGTPLQVKSGVARRGTAGGWGSAPNLVGARPPNAAGARPQTPSAL